MAKAEIWGDSRYRKSAGTCATSTTTSILIISVIVWIVSSITLDNTHRLDLEGMKEDAALAGLCSEQLKEYEAELAKKAGK